MTDDSTCLVRAAYTAETITVYQAYGPQIADPAVRAGTFVPPFSRDRMTWIKPSFGWMMHLASGLTACTRLSCVPVRVHA